MSNSTLYIIVDDADPAITYSPGWTTETSPNAVNTYYKGTSHGRPSFATPKASSLSYSFHGTEVLIGGLIPPNNTETPVRCLVDGALQTLSVSDLTLCHVTNLSDDVHQLNLSFGSTAEASSIVVDYLLYVPSQTNSSQPPNQTGVSRDIFLTPNNQDIELEGWSPMDSEGLAGMQTNGTDATLSLNFNGNSVTWFNCLADTMPPNTSITYTIDSEDGQFTRDNFGSAILFNQSLPSSNGHQFKLFYHGDSQSQFPLTLCGLAIGNRSISPPPTATSMTSPPPSSTSSSNAVDATSRMHSQTAVIVGGVVGGIILAFLVVLAFLLYILWRKRRRMVDQLLHAEFATVSGTGNKLTTDPRNSQITLSSLRKSVIPKRSSIAKSLLSTFTAFRPSPQTAQVGSDYGCSPPNSPLDTRHSYTSKISG